jgi:competence protein ComEA
VEEPLRERLGDWIAALGRRQLIALAVVAVATLGGAVVWYLRALPRPVEVTSAGGPTPAAMTSASPSPAVVVVHVAGWVRRPGVYELPVGSRVIDAIDLAGGPREGADLSALNLAAVLSDAQQVLVPKRGPPGSAPGGAGGGGAAGGLVNLNSATVAELETLPGIGPVLAQKIVDYRTEHGPFTRVEDLMNVSGIGEARFAELKDKVTV